MLMQRICIESCIIVCNVWNFLKFGIHGFHIVVVVNLTISCCTHLSTQKNWSSRGASKYSFSFVRIRDKGVYVKPCFFTLVGSNANSSNDNPCERWIVLAATSCTGNWILVIKCDWTFPTLISFTNGSIGV
jgi:hypothetical protein